MNHSADDRYGSGTTTTKTHNQNSITNDKSCKKLTDILWEAKKYDAFFINEGQFFPDLLEFVPNAGIKSSKIIGLSEDIARAMSSLSARTQTTLDYQSISHPVIGENFPLSISINNSLF